MNRFSLKTLKLLVGALVVSAPLMAGAYNFTQPFSYYANNVELKKALSAFSLSQGFRSSNVAANVQGRISGRFQNINPDDFVKALEEAYNVGYYVLGREIHFYRLKDTKRRQINIRSGTGTALMQYLRASNLVANELPARLNPQGTMLTITGPEAYVNQLQSAATTYENEQAAKIVMQVFPLKYAWAEDVEFSSMDKTVTVPGIATVLRGMVMGQSVSGQTVTTKDDGIERLGAPGVAKKTKAEKEQEARAQKGSPVSTGSISIMADPRVNAVLVSDVAYRMPYYQKVIADLDKPVELVEIHAAIVDVDTSANLDLGINYGGGRTSSYKNGRLSSAGYAGAETEKGEGTVSSIPSGSIDPISSVATAAGLALSTIYDKGTDFFMARISALESDNEAKILGRPSILTVDNVQATLENTTTYYVKLQGREAVDLVKVEAGTVLRVTPHIIRENGKTSIKLLVNVQDDQESGAGVDYSASTGNVPPIKQTKINTQAVVDVGQSLLIGGYYYEQKNKGTSGVPLLKDIPLLGYLFRSTSNSSRRMERLILITPRIVTSSGGNAPMRVATPDFQQSATQADYEDQRLKGRK